MSTGGILASFAGWRGFALAFVIGLGAGGLATAKVQGAFHEAEIYKLKETQAKEAADAARIALAEIVRLQNTIAGIEADAIKELTHAIAENKKLHADIAAGARRLSVRITSCTPVPGSTGAGMVDGSGRADIDPRDAGALISTAKRGDLEIIKLNTLQRIVEAWQQGRTLPFDPPSKPE